MLRQFGTWDGQGMFMVVASAAVGHLVDTAGGLHGFGVFPAEGDDSNLDIRMAGCCHRGRAAFVAPSFKALEIHELKLNAGDFDPNLSFNRVSRTLTGASSTISAMAASADGRLIAAGGGDGVLHCWQEDDEPAGRLDLHSPIRSLAIAEDGVVVAATVDHLLALRVV
ncbi:hypothetical protein [Streptomyces regalis]|uniref:Uncharacterized protein n=1 Tax=Streptomyces regalis TaxID=68262 RepID=A0A0X3UT02_9ACTN|nr:hypothetical protein [Streptomyces regalis]KUL34006.1 hypothetical protein ADL12_20990 [Streptomyces regalis]